MLEHRMVQSLETTEDPAIKTELSQVIRLWNDELKCNVILAWFTCNFLPIIIGPIVVIFFPDLL